jgi:hypothetical protein
VENILGLYSYPRLDVLLAMLLRFLRLCGHIRIAIVCYCAPIHMWVLGAGC